jgi:Protein of unknown function (DUF3108)
LGVATVVAVLAHVWLAMLASPNSFMSQPGDARVVSLNTRWVTLEAQSPPQSESLIAAPDARATAQPAPPRTAAAPEKSSSVVAVVEHVKNESNRPLTHIDTAQNAIKNIANSAPNPSFDSPTKPFAAAPGSPAAHSMLYPPALTLQFEGASMSRGNARSTTGELRWATDGLNYELSLQAAAWLILTRTEKSVGSLGAHGLAPVRFSSSRTGRSEQATHFRYEVNRIQFSANKPDEALMAGAQDRLSVLIQLAGMLAGEPGRYKAGDRIGLQVAGLDNAQVWEFSIEGPSGIKLPVGELQAVKLRRAHRHEYDQSLEIWLAPDLGYLPVRILQSARATPERDFTDLVLSRMP